MAITDSGYMMRDGSTSLSSTETGTGQKYGPCPLRGMLFSVLRPADGTSFTVKWQESDALGSGYTDMATPASVTYTDDGYAELRAFWTKQYVRHVVTACTGNFGAVEIGLVQGSEASSV